MTKVAALKSVANTTNGAAEIIAHSEPYTVSVQLTGSADFLFHRWNCEAVDEKARAAKNSKAKKTDDIESYVYRNDVGELCIPGEYLRQSIIHAAKFKQDPRSPRKSAMDLYKAGVVALTALAPVVSASLRLGADGRCQVGKGVACRGGERQAAGAGEAWTGMAGQFATTWDYEDRRRVVIQRNGVNRVRPAMRAGWVAEFELMVLVPEYITTSDLLDTISTAGRLVGIGDFRPTYGRFGVTRFE